MNPTTSNTPASTPNRVDEPTWLLSGCIPPDRKLVTIPITNSSFRIGRRTGNDLQIPSMCVSGEHAEILEVAGFLFIRDLGSTNGTFVNRRRIQNATPLWNGDHVEIADVEFRVESRRPVEPSPHDEYDARKTAQAIEAFDPDWYLSRIDELISRRAVIPHYQKIVSFPNGMAVGFEALARSQIRGIESPATMFETAELVGREVELSLVCRSRAIEVAQKWLPSHKIFVNTHPHESLSADVVPAMTELRRRFPSLRICLEVHEGTIHDPKRMREVRAILHDHDIQLAYDDFGAGQSRLLELVQAPPDFLKFDACLLRDVTRASENQCRFLKMLLDMAHDVPTVAIAEGIETSEEAEMCRELGFDLGQGYFFGRPAPAEDLVEGPTQRLQPVGEDTAIPFSMDDES